MPTKQIDCFDTDVDLGLSPDVVLDPHVTRDLSNLWERWQHEGFASLNENEVLCLRQDALRSHGNPHQSVKERFLKEFEWESRNRSNMAENNTFFRIPSGKWSIHLKPQKRKRFQVFLGEQELDKRVSSILPCRVYLEPEGNKTVLTHRHLPDEQYCAILRDYLNRVREKGGLPYLLGQQGPQLRLL